MLGASRRLLGLQRSEALPVREGNGAAARSRGRGPAGYAQRPQDSRSEDAGTAGRCGHLPRSPARHRGRHRRWRGRRHRAPAAAAAPGAAEAGRLPDLAMDDGRPWQTRLGINYQTTTDQRLRRRERRSNSTAAPVSWSALVTSCRITSRSARISLTTSATTKRTLPGTIRARVFPVTGNLESMGVMFDLSYYFMTGRFTPFVTTGLGWNFVDTNIPTAPPQVGCWWNPWYGYICEGFQDTKSVDGFAYQAGRRCALPAKSVNLLEWQLPDELAGLSRRPTARRRSTDSSSS